MVALQDSAHRKIKDFQAGAEPARPSLEDGYVWLMKG